MLLGILLAQNRLEDGMQRRRLPPGERELWNEALHPDWLKPAAAAPFAAAPDCPILLSVNPQSPFSLTAVDDGVQFDIDGNGAPDHVSWTAAGADVSFLALDWNTDRAIGSGRELIGRHTLAGVSDGPNVLIALASEAVRGGQTGGTIDSENPLFAKLLFWTDANHNGVSESGELRPASDALSAIGLGWSSYHRRDAHGNETRRRGFAFMRTEQGSNQVGSRQRDPARRRWMYEVCLAAS